MVSTITCHSHFQPVCFASLSPILTGKPGGNLRVMKSRNLAKWALLIAIRSMIGVTCSTRERGWSSQSHRVALNLANKKQVSFQNFPFLHLSTPKKLALVLTLMDFHFQTPKASMLAFMSWASHCISAALSSPPALTFELCWTSQLGGQYYGIPSWSWDQSIPQG